MKYLSVILPVFNNSDVLKKNIGYLTGFLSEKKYDYEIIIVDDGSKFASEIKLIADENKTGYIRIEKNTGKGEAIKVGMLRASGKYRVFTDADIPYEKESLSRVIEKLDKEKYDVVVGDRTCVKSSYFKNISFLRSFGSKLFSFIVWGITAGKFGDTQCGLKGFSADSALKIFSKSLIKGFAIDVEILYLSLKNNYNIGKVPVVLREQSTSTVSILKHGFLMLVDLVKIKYYQLRNKYE